MQTQNKYIWNLVGYFVFCRKIHELVRGKNEKVKKEREYKCKVTVNEVQGI